MADTKVSDLPDATTLDGTELVPVVQSGSKKATVNQILASAADALDGKVNGDFSILAGSGTPDNSLGDPDDWYIDEDGVAPVTSNPSPAGPRYNWELWGSISELDGALLQQAVDDIMDAEVSGGRLLIPSGHFDLDRFIQTTGLDGSRASKRVDIMGAGIGNSVFHATTQDSCIADNEPFYDGTIGAGTTTTHIEAATGVFKQSAVGRQLVALIAGNSIDRDITAVAPDGSWVTVSPAYASAPTLGDPWAVAPGTVSRGHYFGHFTMDCENIADYGVYVGLGAEKYLEYIRVLTPLKSGFLWEGTQNSGSKMLEAIGSHEWNHEFSRGPGNLWLEGTMASTGGLGGIWIHQGGLTTQQSVPDKITFFGGLAEEAKETVDLEYIATILVGAGNRVAFRGFAVNNAGSALYPAGNTSAVKLAKEAVFGGPIKVLWDGGQIDGKVGTAVDLSGAGAGGGVAEFHLQGSPNLKGTPTGGLPYFGWRDDTVEVQVGAPTQKFNDLTNRGGPITGGTATRSFGDVVRFGSTRCVKPTADYGRSSVSPDDGVTFTAVPGLHLERIGQNSTGELKVRLVVDGATNGNIRVKLTTVNGVTFIGTMQGIPTTDTDALHEVNSAPVAMNEDRSFKTLGVGTKTVIVIEGEVVGPTTGSGYGQLSVEIRQNNSQTTATTVYRAGSKMVLKDSGI